VSAIIAHRGASQAARENTVEAFQFAVELGADGVELDVRRTRDDVLIVHHDPWFRTLDGAKILIRSVAAADLPGHIPTLSAALGASAGAFVNVEVKNAADDPDFDSDREMVAAVVEELSHWDTRGWVISSFDRGVIDRVRLLAPHLVTAWLTVETNSADLDDLVRAGHGGIHPWAPTLTAELVQEAHRRGLFVNTWTCNEIDEIRKFAGWGVDGIVTDVPDIARNALTADERSMGQRSMGQC
jgi:glycerophosphoryl diester phosphodiesterase